MTEDDAKQKEWFMLFGYDIPKPTTEPSFVHIKIEPKTKRPINPEQVLSLWHETKSVSYIAKSLNVTCMAVRRTLARNHIDLTVKNAAIPILAYKIKTGEFVGEYASINDACLALGLTRSSVQRVVSDMYKQTNGYRFKYKK